MNPTRDKNGPTRPRSLCTLRVLRGSPIDNLPLGRRNSNPLPIIPQRQSKPQNERINCHHGPKRLGIAKCGDPRRDGVADPESKDIAQPHRQKEYFSGHRVIAVGDYSQREIGRQKVVRYVKVIVGIDAFPNRIIPPPIQGTIQCV
jgi:hypothetical protein